MVVLVLDFSVFVGVWGVHLCACSYVCSTLDHVLGVQKVAGGIIASHLRAQITPRPLLA